MLYIIQGFLGAGKTTWSRDFALRGRMPRLNADEWCEANRSPEQLAHNWDACFAEAVGALWEEAAVLLKNGQDVILDFGFWSRASRDHARETAGKLGVEIRHYYIFAPDEVLLARIAKRAGPVAERNVKKFRALKELFDEPAADEDAIMVKNYGKE